MVVRRLAAAALGSLGVGRAARALAQDDDDDTTIDIHAGSAGAQASGGDVVSGDVDTGGNRGDQITVGDSVAGEGDATVSVGTDTVSDSDPGDATVVVDGGNVTTTTELQVSADGGTANASANGGSNTSVDVEIEVDAVVDSCAGVVCSQCQTCDPETGTCIAAREGGACRNANACTTGDTCQGGICVAGDRKACDECFDCDPETGNCRPAPGATCTATISGTPTPGVCIPFGSPVGIVCCPGASAFVRLAHARRAMLGR
jgi:hypothetical protein